MEAASTKLRTFIAIVATIVVGLAMTQAVSQAQGEPARMPIGQCPPHLLGARARGRGDRRAPFSLALQEIGEPRSCVRGGERRALPVETSERLLHQDWPPRPRDPRGRAPRPGRDARRPARAGRPFRRPAASPGGRDGAPRAAARSTAYARAATRRHQISVSVSPTAAARASSTSAAAASCVASSERRLAQPREEVGLPRPLRRVLAHRREARTAAVAPPAPSLPPGPRPPPPASRRRRRVRPPRRATRARRSRVRRSLGRSVDVSARAPGHARAAYAGTPGSAASPAAVQARLRRVGGRRSRWVPPAMA